MRAAIKLWATHLNDIEDEYVNKAMEGCVDKFSWAPDVAEFKKLCLSYKGSTNLPWAADVLKFEKPKRETYSNGQVKTLIDEGAEICNRLKKIYPDQSWMKIAKNFTKLKQVARKYHEGLDDLKLVRALLSYKDQDLIDALEIDK